MRLPGSSLSFTRRSLFLRQLLKPKNQAVDGREGEGERERKAAWPELKLAQIRRRLQRLSSPLLSLYLGGSSFLPLPSSCKELIFPPSKPEKWNVAHIIGLGRKERHPHRPLRDPLKDPLIV